MSPVKRCGCPPEKEESEYDQQCQEDNPDASDSEEEGDEVGIAAAEASSERFKDTDVAVKVEWCDYVSGYMHDREDRRENNDNKEDNVIEILGAPKGWKKPAAPDKWKPNKPRTKAGEPSTFAAVDNPGGWLSFTYRPYFNQQKKNQGDENEDEEKEDDNADNNKGKYLYHCIPTGATPAPEQNGKRSVAGYDFHYKGWKTSPTDNTAMALQEKIHSPNKEKDLLTLTFSIVLA